MAGAVDHYVVELDPMRASPIRVGLFGFLQPFHSHGRPGEIVVSAGFNDVTGINGDGVANNSPYNVANASLAGQGAGEPGWFDTWGIGGAPLVVNTGMAEGDGAVFLQGTSAGVRTL